MNASRHPHADARPGPHAFSAAVAVALALLVVAAGVLAAHWPALRAQAVWLDDEQYLLENRLVLRPSWAHAGTFLAEVFEPSTVEGYYQPLTMISLMLDVATGAGPGHLTPIHRTNLLLHTLNALLAAVFVMQIFRSAAKFAPDAAAHRPRRPPTHAQTPAPRPAPGLFVAAATAGLLFGLHPLTVETIAWIAERKTLLATHFALLSLIAYVRFCTTRSRGAYGCCVLGFVLALLSKPTVTTLPLVMLVLDAWPLGRLGSRAHLKSALLEKTPLFLLSGVSAIITIVSQSRTAVIHMPQQYPLAAIPVMLAHNIAFYARTFAWPSRLVPYYVPPAELSLSQPAILTGLIGTAIILAVLAVTWRWTRVPAASWLIWFTAILPTTGIIGFTGVIAADKYMYLPMLGFVIGIAWGLMRLWTRLAGREPAIARAAVIGAIGVVASAELRTTRAAYGKWQDTARLFETTLAAQPRAGIVHNNYANHLVRQGRHAQAMAHFIEATRHNPEFEKGWHNLGALLDRQGHLDQAIPLYEHALRIKPDYVDALLSLGNARVKQNKLPEATEVFRRLTQMRPDVAAGHQNLAGALVLQQRWDEAIGEYRQALRLQGDYLEAELGLAHALAASGRPAEAIEGLMSSAKAHPGSELVPHTIADLLGRQGRHAEAEQYYREAIRLNPGWPVAHNDLASALFAQGRAEEALARAREAIRLDPQYANAHFNAGTLLLQLGRPNEAIPELERALQQRAGFSKGEHYLAIALEQAGRLDEAIAHYREALRLDPGNEQIQAGLREALANRPHATSSAASE